MKKLLSYSLLLIAMFALFTACGQKKEANPIDELGTLVQDMQLNANNYTSEQWHDAFNTYNAICQRLANKEVDLSEEDQKTLDKYCADFTAIYTAHNPSEISQNAIVEPLIEGEDISDLFE